MKQKELKLKKKEILNLISEHKSIAYIARELHCSRRTLERFFENENISYKGNQSSKGVFYKDLFTINSSAPNSVIIKRIIDLELLPHDICDKCKVKKWNNIQLTMELDHINGDNTDNRLENLRFLCPNCHSQTNTFRGRNVNKGNKKVSDSVLIKAIKENTSIRKALIAVGLSPKGANYQRVYNLLEN